MVKATLREQLPQLNDCKFELTVYWVKTCLLIEYYAREIILCQLVNIVCL